MKLTPLFTAACWLTFLPYQLASASDLPHTFTFTQGSWIEQWNTPWQARLGSTQVVATPKAPGSDQSLLVSYPEGAVGPKEGGVQFPIVLDGIEGFEPHYSSLTLDYCLKFKPGFDFVKGGKLPGLMGSEGAWARSGGDQPDGSNGWTLRYMWRENGRAVVYAYLPPSPNGRYGNAQWGQDIELGKSFFPGRWHCLKQSVKVNDLGEENGELHVWFDGEKVLSRTDISYRLKDTPAGMIGGIYVSTFHGGNTPDWSPSHDSYLLLNDLRLTH